jgi:hypothetical protein
MVDTITRCQNSDQRMDGDQNTRVAYLPPSNGNDGPSNANVIANANGGIIIMVTIIMMNIFFVFTCLSMIQFA